MDAEPIASSNDNSSSDSDEEEQKSGYDQLENKREVWDDDEDEVSGDKRGKIEPMTRNSIFSRTSELKDIDSTDGSNRDLTMPDSGWDTDLDSDEASEGYDGSLKAIYVEACKKNGIVPASYFLRNMTKSVMEMKHHGLGSLGAKAICVALSSNTHIVKLNLSDNWLGKEGGEHVCDMLRENCYIHEIDLSDNKLEVNFAKRFVEVAEFNTALNCVNLSGNELDDNAAVYIAAAIQTTVKIENLNLSKNKLSEQAGVLLGAAIADNTTIRQLDLSWNSITRKGATSLAAGLKTNVYLQRLNLSWNGMGNDGAKAIGDALRSNNILLELDISNNRINTEGAALFSKGLVANESLKILRMGKNPLQSVGCCAVVSALLKNANSVINELDFTDITVGRECIELFARLKERLPNAKLIEGTDCAPKRQKARVHPMVKLKNYIEKHNLRLVDFFNRFDTDHSMSVTHEEFTAGIEQTGIKLTADEIQQLINELDKDGDGEINFSELVMGHQDFAEKEKKMSSTLLVSLKSK